MNNLVDVVAGDDKSFQNMSTFLCLLQVKLGAADGHLMAVLNKVADALAQSKESRIELRMVVLAWNQRDVIY